MNQNKKRYIAGALVLMAVLVTSVLIQRTPHLNKADLFEPQVTGSDSNALYMPSYYADIGEEGLIEIKAKDGLKPFDGISFFMGYSPEQYLTFGANPLVFDGTTVFQKIASQKVTKVNPGLLEVTILLQDPVTVDGVTLSDPSTHKTLFKIKTVVSPNIPDEQQIDVTFKGVVMSNGEDSTNMEIEPSSILATGKAQAEEFSQLSVSSVSPSEISNKVSNNITFTGKDLDLVKEVVVGKTSQTITNKTASSLTIKIPANQLMPDLYQITFYDQLQNELVLETQLKVTDEVVQAQQTPKEEEPELKPAATGAPKILLDKAYTNPKTVVNDGKTPFTLYVLVEDKNNDIKTVMADLSKIGQIGPQNPGTLGQQNNAIPTKCPTGSNVIACMEPTVKEGQYGQWFVLSNVTVKTTVQPSPTPYKVDVTATDDKGNKDKKSVSVYVGDKNATPLKAVAAVATSETSVEVMFNREVKISTTGKGFTISSSSNVEETLSVTHATLDSTGTVVTLTTAKQTPAKKYVVNVAADVKDISGSSVQGAASKRPFDGFQKLNRPPVVNQVSATSVGTVQIEFQRNLKLSSITNAVATIYNSQNSQQRLKIFGLSALSARTLVVHTDLQVPNHPYRLNIEGLVSYDGTASLGPINTGFTGYNLPLTVHAQIVRRADFNNNGKVDFADFTIFASVYGAVYSGAGENLNQSFDQSQSQYEAALKIGQPLQSNPDSLVPHTSPPNGGDI